MKFSEIIRNVEVLERTGPELVEVSAVESDSRRVKSGSLFVAVPGFEADGAEFINQAIERGATAVITERDGQTREGVAVAKVSDARRALAMAASSFYGRPASKLRLIGVTGTSGKTTTTKMIESILDQTGEPVGLIGTIEYRAGDEREVADRTTPDATVLQKWFAKMVDAGVSRAVMEVSSHALALKRTADVPFAAAVFTNLSRDHFDFHRDFDDYFSAKKILFDQIDRTRRTAIVNRDDEWGRKLIDELGEAALTFGLEDADVRPAEGFEANIDGLRGTILTPWGDVVMSSPLLGTPNLYNWMGAIGAALTVGSLHRGRPEWHTRARVHLRAVRTSGAGRFACCDRRLRAQAGRPRKASPRDPADESRPADRSRIRVRWKSRQRKATPDGRDCCKVLRPYDPHERQPPEGRPGIDPR